MGDSLAREGEKEKRLGRVVVSKSGYLKVTGMRGEDGLSMAESFKETKKKLKMKGMVFGHESTRKLRKHHFG